jgi:hypothetical protein
MKKIQPILLSFLIMLTLSGCGNLPAETGDRGTSMEPAPEVSPSPAPSPAPSEEPVNSLYDGIPDSMFPIPMMDGAVIPYSSISVQNSEFVRETFYSFFCVHHAVSKCLILSYQEQLREAGFTDRDELGPDDIILIYHREEDGAVLSVSIYHAANADPADPYDISAHHTFIIRMRASYPEPPERAGEIYTVPEAQRLLLRRCEHYGIIHIPEMDKERDGILLYGFTVDYSALVPGRTDTLVYAWVNSVTGDIRFEEIGYTEEDGPNWYANIPDSIFPIPMLDGEIIQYEWFSPPEYMSDVLYFYTDVSVMEIYQAQLKDAGFVEHTVWYADSNWVYYREEDGTKFDVNMWKTSEEALTMVMVVFPAQ